MVKAMFEFHWFIIDSLQVKKKKNEENRNEF
jgi:hypothetical protein